MFPCRRRGGGSCSGRLESVSRAGADRLHHIWSLGTVPIHQQQVPTPSPPNLSTVLQATGPVLTPLHENASKGFYVLDQSQTNQPTQSTERDRASQPVSESPSVTALSLSFPVTHSCGNRWRELPGCQGTAPVQMP